MVLRAAWRVRRRPRRRPSGRHDPLAHPRMAQMHRWDYMSLRWLLDARLRNLLTVLVGASRTRCRPCCTSSRGLPRPGAAPGQLLPARAARHLHGRLDGAGRCDEANGCMQIVPGSHPWPLLCTTEADTRVSFTDVTVPLPQGQPVEPVLMKLATCCSSTARWSTAAFRT